MSQVGGLATEHQASGIRRRVGGGFAGKWGGGELVRARTARGCWAVILMAQAALGRRRSPAQQQDRVQEGVVACYTIRMGLQGRGGG